MSYETSEGEYQGTGLVVSREVVPASEYQDRPIDGEVNYTFRRAEASGDDDPYVRINRVDQGADTAFNVQCPQRPATHNPAGNYLGELNYEALTNLDEVQSGIVAEELANFMFHLAEVPIPGIDRGGESGR
jgi:hypothetical protein